MLYSHLASFVGCDMEARKLVGWNVRRLRVERELTIEALADLERGEENIGIDALSRPAKAFGLKLGELTVEHAPGARAPKPWRAARKAK